MSQTKADYIKVDGIPEGYHQTNPVDPANRIGESEVRIELMDESDIDEITKAFYNIWPPIFWEKREPPSLRPPHDIRRARLAKRLLPTLSMPTVKWIKAVHAPSSAIMGLACWHAPGTPAYLPLARSAVERYGFKEKMGWTDAEIDEMWEHVSQEHWSEDIENNDAIRREVVGDRDHWFLAPLLVWQEWQGRGVGRKLMNWAIEQADATDPPTPMYLESAITARAVYLRCGFQPLGKVNMVRWGPGGEKKGGEEKAGYGKKVEGVVDVL